MVNHLSHVKYFSTNAPNLQKDEYVLDNDFDFLFRTIKLLMFCFILSPFIRVEVFFVRADGTKIRGTGKLGDSLLDVVVNNSIDLDGFGACEGTLTCSTCHLIFKQEDFERLPGIVS